VDTKTRNRLDIQDFVANEIIIF